MSDTTNPLSHSAQAAHEIVLEMIRAGKLGYAKDAADLFTFMLDHYRSELARIQKENKVQ